MPVLNLDASPHARVFRELVRTLRDDDTLRRVVRHWEVWDGTQPAGLPMAPGKCPAVMLTPSEGPDRFYGPSGMIGPLVVSVVVATLGTRADDAMDLYHAIRRAVYPRDAALRLAIHQALVAAGAEAHYVVEFTQPSFAPVDDADGRPAMFVADGVIRVNVVSELNP